jgi:mycobactin lysine-N-oxygenase
VRRLVVIGAGPKAMAIAAKHAVLKSEGFAVPELHVVERRQVGANWSGDFGFTDGKQPLGTSPEKDVGFPFDGSPWGERGPEVSRKMAEFTWQSFLVRTGRYSEWIDRGRPAPEHRVWAQYLRWVCCELEGEFTLHCGEVVSLGRRGESWEVVYRKPGGDRVTLCAEGVVFTGPARQKLPESVPVHDRVLDVESFWKTYERFERFEGDVAVVGTGENAASITSTLASFRNSALKLSLVSPRGMVYSRGEGFRENRVYSDPVAARWAELSPGHRRDFIHRTDRSVFSLQALKVLDALSDFEILPGRVRELRAAEAGRVAAVVRYQDEDRLREFDYVILATGADPLRFLKDLADDRASELLEETFGGPFTTEDVEGRIGFDLAVEGLTPRLHFPGLAGMRQGPGFANLSSLGRLSDRILGSYVEDRA